MIINKRITDETQLNIAKELSARLGVLQETAELLVNRGITDYESAYAFLHPSKANFHNPFDLAGMSEAVERITSARDNGEVVVVYGDYDADGICATTVLYYALKEFGVDCYTVIPERENGYGLREEVIDQVIDEYFPDLLVTVDCGVSGVEQVEYLKDLGVDVIVTDHHELPDKLPDCTVVNCKLREQKYPFDGLCGAGVAYKLSYALIGEKADKYLDFVAIATIADNMSLVGENRDIVYEGLNIIKEGKSIKPLKTLIAVSGIKDINSTVFAFSLAPRINAAGRMGDAFSALKLFLSSSEYEINTLCEKLTNYNIARQSESESLYKSAKLKIKDRGDDFSAIILQDDSWKNGLVGNVSAKLAEEYNVPAILFVNKGGVLHGSARSVDNINIYEAISACSEYLIEFGGHSQAAGLSVTEENLPLFDKALCEYISDKYANRKLDSDVEVERIIDGRFDVEFAREINMFEPFGIGNKKPLFATKIGSVVAEPVKFGSPHLSIHTDLIDMMYFSGVKYQSLLQSNLTKIVIFDSSLTIFNKQEYLKGYVKDIIVEGNVTEDFKYETFERGLYNLADEKCENVLNTNETLSLIDELLKSSRGTLFVACDNNTLEKYPNLKDLSVCYYNCKAKGGVNSVLITAESFEATDYKNIVYLDKPIVGVSKFSNNCKVYVNAEIEAYNLSEISLDRNVFADIFKTAVAEGRSFNSGLELKNKYISNYSKEQVIFTVAVFMELGIFRRIGGRIVRDNSVKRELGESKLYSKLKERL